MKHLSKSEISALLESAKEWSPRDHAMILVGYLHGLRATEIIRLTSDDVRDGFIRVARQKGSAMTVQPLMSNSDPLFDEVVALTSFLGAGRLFSVTRQRFWAIMKFHGRRAGLPAHKVFPHSLKHSTAKHALAGGMPLDELQNYLGHRSLASTACYLKADNASASAAFAKAMGV